MILYPTWQDIGLRLFLAVAAGGLVGFNREVHGHFAGMRTTILVALAACVAMIQANLLLPLEGRNAGSFAEMDILRFPLGVLTGVGFIGGGAILRRGSFVTGVTTAATLWAITAIGLCFGGGQLGVGGMATLITFLTLSLLKWVEERIPRQQRGLLTVSADGPMGLSDLPDLVRPDGYDARFVSRRRQGETGREIVSYDIRWHRAAQGKPPGELFSTLEPRYQIESFETETEIGH